MIGDGAGYEERGVYDRTTNRYEAAVKPNRLADKLTVELAFSTVPLGDARCRRIVDGSVTAKIFAIGGMLEQRMISDLKKSYEKSAAFTNKFVAEKGWLAGGTRR